MHLTFGELVAEFRSVPPKFGISLYVMLLIIPVNHVSVCDLCFQVSSQYAVWVFVRWPG